MTTTTRTRPKAPVRPRPRAAQDGAPKAPERMDPRMRARRAAVRRGAGRKRLRRLLVMAAVAAVAGVLYLTTRSPLLDVDHIRVQGAANTGTDAVLAASGIERGEPMTDVPLGSAHDEIAKLPWVESVRIERRWPGTITIDVVERQAVASLQAADGTWALLDGSGRVLTHQLAAPPELPAITVDDELSGVGGRQHGVSGALAVARMLTPDLRAWVQSVRPGPEGTADLLLHGDIRVELGSQAHVSDKLVDLATVLTRVDLTDLATIDVSVVLNPVVTRHAA